nr:cue domain-containing protein [Quercus suber]
MSDVDTRPAPTRGRSSRGRGGFSSRGGSRTHNASRKPTNGTATTLEAPQVEEEDILADQGELGEMKKKYASELLMLKDMFSEWTDVDLLFALQETDGDLHSTIDKITQGNVSQFAEVKKTKDRARSKAAKDEPPITGATDKPTARGGRGRGGFEGVRGARGRGSDRGRGGLRGGRGGHATTNGIQKDATTTSVPTAESTAWDTTTTDTMGGALDTSAPDGPKEAATDGTGKSSWGNVVTAEATPATASEGMKGSLLPAGGSKKSWASMFSQPKPAAVATPAKQASVSQPLPAELVAMKETAAVNEPDNSEPSEPQVLPQSTIEGITAAEVPHSSLLAAQDMPEEASIPISQAPLTEENVENLPDKSHPPATETVASTAGSVDTRHLTPLPSQPAPSSRPSIGGFATSAYRATGTPVRSASYQRKVQEQLEAVVMPGHNAIDRTAVQFGSMGLNGEPGPDVDEDREEPETRHAPQHSPPSQPRTSLPPAPRQATAIHEASDGLPTPKQAPGLPPASTQNQQQMQEAGLPSGLTQDQAQMNASYNQYRYAQPGMHQDSSLHQHKPHDPFAHQAQPNQYDPYGSHAQTQQVSQHQQAPSGFAGLSSAPNDYSSYYTSDQSRNSYNQYYGSYGHQDSRGPVGQTQQEAGLGQQRSASGFGAGPNDSAFQSQAQQQVPTRYNETPGSGQNTPNPLMNAPQQQQPGPAPQQSQHSMHQAQAHQQQQQQPSGYPPGASAAYPYGHPYYSSPYQTAYQNQFGYSHPSGGYGGGYQGKPQAGMYNVPQGYSQSSYEQHSSSPANTGAFGSNQPGSMRNASGMSSGLGGGLDEYGRASTQSGSHQQSSGFGGMNDPFTRSTSGFGGQTGYGQQNTAGAPDDTLKPFNETKGGPSPTLGQPGRPGSAANSTVGASQSGLPPPQSQQQSSFGGSYPGFAAQGSQYGGLGGLGNHQQGQQGQAAYSQYGAGFSQTYGGYGTQQQRGGGPSADSGNKLSTSPRNNCLQLDIVGFGALVSSTLANPAKMSAKRPSKKSTPTTRITAASKAGTSPIPTPFTPAADNLRPLLERLDPALVYITHIDRFAVAAKQHIFLIPVLLNGTIALLLLWRFWAAFPTYVALAQTVLEHARGTTTTGNAAARTTLRAQLLVLLRRTLMFAGDFALFRFVGVWPLTFFAEQPANPVSWRWHLGFREKEVIVRESRGWGAADLLAGVRQGQENAFFKTRILPAISREGMAKTGYLMMDRSWDLDFEVMVDAHKLISYGTLNIEELDKIVLAHLDGVGWVTWRWESGSDVVEDRRKKVVMFKELLTKLGKESLFWKWMEIVEDERDADGGFTVERQRRVAKRVQFAFEKEGVDFAELVEGVGGLEELPAKESGE